MGGGDDAPSKPAEGAAAPASGSEGGSSSGGGIMETIQGLHVGERVRGALRAYNELDEKGTPLRPYIRAARESVNDAAGAVKVRGRACGCMRRVRACMRACLPAGRAGGREQANQRTVCRC